MSRKFRVGAQSWIWCRGRDILDSPPLPPPIQSRLTKKVLLLSSLFLNYLEKFLVGKREEQMIAPPLLNTPPAIQHTAQICNIFATFRTNRPNANKLNPSRGLLVSGRAVKICVKTQHLKPQIKKKKNAWSILSLVSVVCAFYLVKGIKLYYLLFICICNYETWN